MINVELLIRTGNVLDCVGAGLRRAPTTPENLLQLKNTLMQTIMRILTALATAAALSVSAAPLPENDGLIHMGAATCASSICHGKSTPIAESPVQLNEYSLWSSDDYHSRAFQVLRNDASKAMAAALNLPNAQNAKICLDCHADNVPGAKRGEKFQLSDGVSCESCHGGAEKWLKSHTDPDATHADNLSKGLFPLSDPIARADVCLSCHMGTQDKLATHAIMAAGHPRLSFELDTFTANQPAHYTVDDDYIKRKGSHAIGYFWLVGQLEAAKRQLSLIEAHTSAQGSLELAIYDCHSCHRAMSPARGRSKDFSADLPAGSMRLLDHSFDMLAVVYQTLHSETYNEFAQNVRNLHLAHTQPKQLATAVAALQAQLNTLTGQIKANPPSNQQIRLVRRNVAQACASGRYGDFTSAEQAFLALESLSYGLGDRAKIKKQLDALYTSLADETAFKPGAFAAAAAELVKVVLN